MQRFTWLCFFVSPVYCITCHVFFLPVQAFVFIKLLVFLFIYLFIFYPQVSNGAVAMAKTTLEQLLVRCATPLKDEEKTEELLAAQDKSFHMVTHDLVREVTSPNSTVRKQAMHSLQVLAQVTGKSVTVIMEPHKEVKVLTVFSKP